MRATLPASLHLQATLGPRVTFPQQRASSGHKATVLSGGRGLTYRAVPQDGHLPVAHQRHDRTPPRGARKSEGRGSPRISRGAGRGGPGEGQWLTEATRSKPKENQNNRAPRSAHVITTQPQYSGEPGARGRGGDKRSRIPSRAAPGSAPHAAPHWSIRMEEGGVTHRREGWASRGAGALGAAHA